MSKISRRYVHVLLRRTPPPNRRFICEKGLRTDKLHEKRATESLFGRKKQEFFLSSHGLCHSKIHEKTAPSPL